MRETPKGTGNRISFPWEVCVPDNAKAGVLRGRVLLSRRYRTAKERASLLVAGSWRGGPLAGPVALVAHVHAPDRRRRDLVNLAKLLHDALEAGGAITDDAQLADVRYIRAAVDRARPRVEVTLSPLPED